MAELVDNNRRTAWERGLGLTALTAALNVQRVEGQGPNLGQFSYSFSYQPTKDWLCQGGCLVELSAMSSYKAYGRKRGIGVGMVGVQHLSSSKARQHCSTYQQEFLSCAHASRDSFASEGIAGWHFRRHQKFYDAV